MEGSPPAGWRYSSLDELADVVSGGTPSRAIAHYWGGPIPWATPTEVSRRGIRYLDSTRESITDAGLKAAGLRVLPAGSVLVTTRATIGAVARARIPVTTNQGFQNLVPHADTDPAWLFYAIEAARPVLHSLAAGSTFREVPRESFRRLRLLVAPQHEQRAIATVLEAIDEAIDRTRTAVEVTQSLERSLLHELLTHGLPGRHTEWKPVASLGAIPLCWEAVKLNEVLLDIEAGSAPPRLNRPAMEDEWGVLRVGSVTWGEYRPAENKALKPGIRPDPTLEVHAGDLLLSRANTPELVGRTVLVRSTPPRRLLSDKTLRLVPAAEVTDQEFLHLVLSAATSRAQLTGAASGSSRSMFNVSQESICNVVVPMPPREEQRRMTEFAVALRYRVNVEVSVLAALRAVKAAASDALLSGRIRLTGDRSVVAT